MKRPLHLIVYAFCCLHLSLRAGDLSEADLTPGEREVRKHFASDAALLTTVRLWPGEAPDEPRPFGAETVAEGKRSANIQTVSLPSFTLVRPPGKSALPVVIVCPGGGYGSLGLDVGGVDVIRWLNGLGVAGAYLKYRVPKRGRDFPMYHQPLQDIQRAVSVLRSRAAEFQIDPVRIGAIGFSAGGNLAAMLATHSAPGDRLYQTVDEADRVSCRPDFVMLVAPAYLTNPIVSANLVPGLQLDKVARNLTPPIFITSAMTDKFAVGASHFALVLREHHVPVEVHFYEKGGHAEGAEQRIDNAWPTMAADWMRRHNLIPSP